jgi:hypothetical protein
VRGVRQEGSVVWIIPRTLSAFVPDTEGLNLALDEQAWMLESSAMWRSKPSSKQTWLRRLKKGGWITHLSGRILKPSLHESFVEKYTDSLEDIHASHSVARGSEKEKKTQGTYGPISESTSGQLDLFGAFSKTSEVTPRWGYGESCPIWKKMVTERSGACSVRRKQARLTNASECSSWPTPLEDDSSNVNPSAKRRTSLVKEVRSNWVTPNSRDWKDSVTKLAKDRKDGKKRNDQLPRQIAEQNWPTPRAGNPGSRKPGTGGKILAEEARKSVTEIGTASLADCSSSEVVDAVTEKCNAENAESGRIHSTTNYPKMDANTADLPIGPPAPEKSNTIGKNHGSPKLNPNWVEQLMGLEVGWTQLPTEWIDSDS